MRRYSNLQALLLSFGSADVYRDAARHWRGGGVLYLLLLALVMTTLVAFRIHGAIGRMATREAPPLIAQLPRITIDKGEASVNVPTPYVIRAPDTGKDAAIIDTSGTVTSLAGSEARVLLTRRQVMFRRNDSETRVFELQGVDHFEIGPERATRWARAAAAWMVPVTFPFVLIGISILRLIQAALAAVVVLLVASMRRVPLDFAAAMRVAAVAITPPTLLLDVTGFLGAQVPYAGPLWAALGIGWIVFAVLACGRAEPPAESGPAAPAH